MFDKQLISLRNEHERITEELKVVSLKTMKLSDRFVRLRYKHGMDNGVVRKVYRQFRKSFAYQLKLLQRLIELRLELNKPYKFSSPSEFRNRMRLKEFLDEVEMLKKSQGRAMLQHPEKSLSSSLEEEPGRLLYVVSDRTGKNVDKAFLISDNGNTIEEIKDEQTMVQEP